MACAGDLTIFCVIDWNSHAFIKHVAKPVPQSPLRMLVLAIANDAAVQLVNIVESLMNHECCELLTTDSACAIGEEGLVFFVSKIVSQPFREFPK